jgi:hypothetical protein
MLGGVFGVGQQFGRGPQAYVNVSPISFYIYFSLATVSMIQNRCACLVDDVGWREQKL